MLEHLARVVAREMTMPGPPDSNMAPISRTPDPIDPELAAELRRRQKLYAELISVLACPAEIQVALLEKMELWPPAS